MRVIKISAPQRHTERSRVKPCAVECIRFDYYTIRCFDSIRYAHFAQHDRGGTIIKRRPNYKLLSLRVRPLYICRTRKFCLADRIINCFHCACVLGLSTVGLADNVGLEFKLFERDCERPEFGAVDLVGESQMLYLALASVHYL